MPLEGAGIELNAFNVKSTISADSAHLVNARIRPEPALCASVCWMLHGAKPLGIGRGRVMRAGGIASQETARLSPPSGDLFMNLRLPRAPHSRRDPESWLAITTKPALDRRFIER